VSGRPLDGELTDTPFFIWFGITMVAGMVVVALSATVSVRSPVYWWKRIAGICLVALLVGSVPAVIHAREPKNNRLVRDVVTEIALSALVPGVVALAARFTARSFTSRVATTAVAAAVLVCLFVATPFLLLLAHCTSGDCL
jgi:hypothetical protein